MRPELPLLLVLSISSSLLHPATSLCVPRASSHPLSHTSLTPAPHPSPVSLPPSPEPAPHPSPVSLPPSPAPAPQRPTATSTNSVFSGTVDGAISSRDGVVKSICGHTDYPDVCLTSIQTLLPSLGNPDAASVLSLQIKALTKRTDTVRSLAAKLASDPTTDPDAKDSYGTVSEFYDDAIDNLDAAADALAAGDKGTVDSMLSAVITNFSDVEDEVGGSEEPCPLSSHNEVLTKMTSNSLAVAQLV